MPWNKNDYPPDWDHIRSRILTRENNRCKFCGVSNGFIFHWVNGEKRGIRQNEWWLVDEYKRRGYSRSQALKKAGFTVVVLTVAHLDHDKDNWQVSDERLAALCQGCHLRYDLPRHINNRKYGRNYTKNQFKLW